MKTLLEQVRAFGFDIEELQLDGTIHRFATTEKPNKKNGWYVGHLYTLISKKPVEVVTVGDWATKEVRTFTSRNNFTIVEEREFFIIKAQDEDVIAKKLAEKREAAAENAKEIWDSGTPVDPNFKYLLKKNLSDHSSLKYIKMELDKNNLIIPMYDSSGQMRCLQRIFPEKLPTKSTDKVFLTGAQFTNMYFTLPGQGALSDIIVCEGFSTASSIYEALGGKTRVIIAFNADNICSVVGQLIKSGINKDRITIAADNDYHLGDKNPGVTVAKKCSLKFGVKYVHPKEPINDFNDLMIAEGLESVAKMFQPVAHNIEKETSAPMETPNRANEAASLNFYSDPSTPLYIEMGDYCLNTMGIICYDGYSLKWNGKSYQPISTLELGALVKKLCGSNYKPQHLRYFRETIAISCSGSDFETADIDNMVNLDNGTYDMSTKKLLPHDRSRLFLSVLPFSYDKDATCPLWLSFIDQVFESKADIIDFLQEIFGFVICDRTYEYHNAFIFLGDGRNGKSVTLKILRALVGEKNTTSVSFDEIHKEFYRAQLFGKTLNAVGELPSKPIDANLLKALISGEITTVSYKNKPQFQFANVAKFVAAANYLPHLSGDAGHAMMERIMLIPFNYTVKREDMDSKIADKLISELPGIFNWALAGYDRLKARGRFESPKEVKSMNEKLAQETSNVVDFYAKRLVKLHTPEAPVKISDLYQEYRNFCFEEGIQDKYISTKNWFVRKLTKKIIQDLGPSVIHTGHGGWVYTNMLRLYDERFDKNHGEALSKAYLKMPHHSHADVSQTRRWQDNGDA